MDSVLFSLNTLALKKNLELNFNFDKNISDFIETDGLKLKQILFNLIGNSIKFTNEGKIQIDILRREKYLIFIIKDTGIGIKEELKEKLFDVFVQGDSSYTKKYQGTGLGLAICKKLVEFLDGEINFESTEGIGSKFYFKIPIKNIGSD